MSARWIGEIFFRHARRSLPHVETFDEVVALAVLVASPRGSGIDGGLLRVDSGVVRAIG